MIIQPARLYKKFWVSTTDITGVVFEVLADKNAYIALCAVEGQIDYDAYEIQIGIENNQVTVIYPKLNDATNQVRASTPNVLDHLQFRAFWISWSYGVIRVGKGGNLHVNELLSYTDPAPHAVGAVGFAAEASIDSHWVITKLIGKKAIIVLQIDMAKTKCMKFQLLPTFKYNF